MTTIPQTDAAVPGTKIDRGSGVVRQVSSAVFLAALVLGPLVATNFVTFQMTMLLVYAIAILALNILTGSSGQFSLGQSAFFAIGAYTSAVLIEHGGVNYLHVAGQDGWRLALIPAASRSRQNPATGHDRAPSANQEQA